ncbi:MAG: SDR family oxidoreductase [Acidimicrobiales bacterium]|jgi:NAD(P)-dependent dehydrogenase (short-subunit alcohol dehydrogenase family)
MKAAIVTGGSKGLGRALALGLADEGWSLVLDARDATGLEEAAREIRSRRASGASVKAISGDVTSDLHRQSLIDAASELGALDLIVNNASELGPSPLPELADYPLESLRRVLEVDVVAPLAVLQQAVRLLEQSENPRVLNITSDASVEHYERWGGYGLAKAALDHLSATFAAENPHVRTWAVDPGDLRTDMHQRAYPGEDISDRPLPESVVARLLSLINSDLTSGRYKASEIPVTEEVGT